MQGPNLRVMAWRNLWRNRRRTMITLVSIAFGGFLAVLMTAMQDRSFADFIDTAARTGGGHVTLGHPDYARKRNLINTVAGGEALVAMAEAEADFGLHLHAEALQLIDHGGSGLGVVGILGAVVEAHRRGVVRVGELQHDAKRRVAGT